MNAPSFDARSPDRFATIAMVLAAFIAVLLSTAPAAQALVVTAHSEAEAALSDSHHNGNSEHALTLPGLSTEFIFDPAGEWTEYDDGTAQLSAVAVDRYNPQWVLQVEVLFTGSTDQAPAGSPKKELRSDAYAPTGPVDTSTWRYYTDYTGVLTGSQGLSGARIEIQRHGPAFQVGVGASGKNVLPGASGWFDYTVLQQPHHTNLPGSGRGDFNLNVHADLCVERAPADAQWSGSNDQHALWLPGIGEDFVFAESSGQWKELAGGQARLTGLVRRLSDPNQAFEIDVSFAGRSEEAPAGSPKKELRGDAYIDQGGPVDPDTWHYYTSVTGSLLGVNDLSGASIAVDRRGPSFQVGVGANGKNIAYGGAGWFDWDLITQPTAGPSLPAGGNGDFNLDFGTCVSVCLDAAQKDPDYRPIGLAPRAVKLRGVVHDLVVSRSQEPYYREYADGTARLYLRLESRADATAAFDLDLDLGGRTDTAPAGSPKLNMPDMAYTENGGPVDPLTWYYYTEIGGTLYGRGQFEGAVMPLTRRGPAFQVGHGASNKNIDFGGSGWWTWTLESQPHSGPTLPPSGDGDGNFDFFCPPPQNFAAPLGACQAQQLVDYQPGITALGGALEPVRMDASRVLGTPQNNDTLNFVSLGFGGSVTLAFDEMVVNGPGADLQLYETTWDHKTCAQYSERVKVWGSQHGNEWIELTATLCQDGQIDLGKLQWGRYFRIEDWSDPADFFEGIAADGADIDGLIAFQCKALPGGGTKG